jgi:polysaccharide export outer membrane protein
MSGVDLKFKPILAKAFNLLGAFVLFWMSCGGSGLSLPLSPGDRIKVSIPEGDEFSGIFDINLDGTLDIPYLPSLAVRGLEPLQVQQLVYHNLIDGGFFQPAFLQVSVKVVRWAPIQVTVTGATFEPGQVLINDRPPEALAQQSTQITGDYPPERFLTAAIRNAGGITPDADIKSIRLVRDGQEQIVDLSGVITGTLVNDVPLIASDQVIVPKASQRNNDLVRPTRITPPGIAIYLSNLTEPAASNASSSITSDSTKLPYGSRFSQAVVAANCAGGIQATNAKRRAILVHTDRLTGQTITLERPIEQLLRHPNEDAINPFLMPGDGVACYDSKVTNARDVLRFMGDIFSPLSILRTIFR